MQSYFTKECKDCNEIQGLVSQIDKKIKEITTNSLLNKKYLISRKVDKRLLMDLIYYRKIGENLKWDSSYYEPCFNRKEIISKIKTLII